MPAPITGDLPEIARKLNASINGWKQRVGLHWPRLTKALGQYMARTVRDNIRKGGRPEKFRPLKVQEEAAQGKKSAAITRRLGEPVNGKYREGGPLWNTGHHILQRIEAQPYGTRGIQIAQFGSAPDGKDVRLIGEVQHFGSMDGRIPARPWLLIPDSEVPGMDAQVTKWVEESIWQKPGFTTP